MNNKNYTIKTTFPTFIAADIYKKKNLTAYSRVESEVGSVAFVPSSFDVGADGFVNIAVVVELGIVAVNPSEVCNKVGTLF